VRVEEAEKHLREQLLTAGLKLNQLEPRKTWEIFKAFAAVSVEGAGPESDDDMCLFEYGTFDWSDGKGARFNWSLVRQFSLYDGSGEYDHMEHLHCDLFFAATPELESLGTEAHWSGQDLDQWAAQVETSEGLVAALALNPVESQFGQEHV
jgi:hypothetical protein